MQKHYLLLNPIAVNLAHLIWQHTRSTCWHIFRCWPNVTWLKQALVIHRNSSSVNTGARLFLWWDHWVLLSPWHCQVTSGGQWAWTRNSFSLYAKLTNLLLVGASYLLYRHEKGVDRLIQHWATNQKCSLQNFPKCTNVSPTLKLACSAKQSEPSKPHGGWMRIDHPSVTSGEETPYRGYHICCEHPELQLDFVQTYCPHGPETGMKAQTHHHPQDTFGILKPLLKQENEPTSHP